MPLQPIFNGLFYSIMAQYGTNRHHQKCRHLWGKHGALMMSDKFFVTLDKSEQEKVQECLSAGLCDNAGDLIRQGIELSHRQLSMGKTSNQRLRTGLTSLLERLERYQG